MKRKLLILLALVVAGCAAGPTPYQPYDRGMGYRDQKLEDNRYRISFAGNSLTPRETVENYLLYHAAEVTLANGYDYFVTAERSTEADTRYTQDYHGGFGYYWYPMPMHSTVSSSTQFEAQADIVMFKGTKPANDPKAFDAHQVKANLEGSVVRPQPKS